MVVFFFWLPHRAVDVKWLLSEITLPPLHRAPRATCKVFADTGITDVGGAAIKPPKIYISSVRFLHGLTSQGEVLQALRILLNVSPEAFAIIGGNPLKPIT